jgi:hypothetical protein
MTGCIGGGSHEIPIENGFFYVASRDLVIVRARCGNNLAGFCSSV